MESASISPSQRKGEITNFVASRKYHQLRSMRKNSNWQDRGEIAAAPNRLSGRHVHELRTPLIAIIGFSEVLNEQFFGPLVEKQEEYVDDILESGKHLLSIINDILDLSKVEAGKMDLELSEISVADLIGNSLIMVKEKAAKHRISIVRDIAKEEKIWSSRRTSASSAGALQSVSMPGKSRPTEGRSVFRAVSSWNASSADAPATLQEKKYPFLEIRPTRASASMPKTWKKFSILSSRSKAPVRAKPPAQDWDCRSAGN
jgi:hypothetical protein